MQTRTINWMAVNVRVHRDYPRDDNNNDGQVPSNVWQSKMERYNLYSTVTTVEHSPNND